MQLKVAGIPHRKSQALVTTLIQAGGFAAINRWLSASDTTGLWNNNDAHPGGVQLAISIELRPLRGAILFHSCTPGMERLAPSPANGLQAFSLNWASSPTVREESRDCPPLSIAPDNFHQWRSALKSRILKTLCVDRIWIEF